MAKRTKKAKNGKATAVYQRVSADKQSHDSQAVDLRAYIRNHGLTNVRWFTDTVSGTADRLPALDEVDKAVFMGELDRVIVWHLDRISRKGIADGCTRLGRWLEKGIEFVCISLPFDFSGPFGEMTAAFCFELAKMERNRISERTKAGLRAARAKGRRLGRKPGDTGHKWSLSKRKIDPALAKSLHAQGEPVAAIAERFGVSRVAVYGALREVGVARRKK